MIRQVVDDMVVIKHAPSTRTADLAARLAAASADPIRMLFAPPLAATPIAAPDGDLVTLEPLTELATDHQPVPWREAGALVARLQACPLPTAPPLPEHGGRAAVTASLARADALHPGGSTDILRELGRTLLRTWPAASDPVVVHGALHLGTIGRLPGTPSWLLTEPGTLGFGQATWDLGLPAGLWHAGLLDDAGWGAFVAGSAEAGGRTPSDGEPWHGLEHPARCAIFMATVREVAGCGDYPHVDLTERAETLLAACVRMNGRRW